jgi:RimJ/RimL family protein N-acetyltransferase
VLLRKLEVSKPERRRNAIMAALNTLESDRLLLRRWRPEDLAPFSRMCADSRVMEYFPSTLTVEECESLVARIEAEFEWNAFGAWACELKETSAFIGFVGLAVPTFQASFTPCVEIAWRIAHEYWGQGLAPEGARVVLDAAFGLLALPEVVSFTAVQNHRSRRVMEKIGMTHDPSGDFDHPSLPSDHALCRHVLYRATRSA